MIDFPTATSLSSELILDLSSLNKSSTATFCCVLLSLLVSAQLPELRYNILMLLVVVVRHERTLAGFDLPLT